MKQRYKYFYKKLFFVKFLRREDSDHTQYCCLLSSIKIFKFTGAVVPGAGAYEIAAHAALTILRESVSTRARLGVQVSNIQDNSIYMCM